MKLLFTIFMATFLTSELLAQDNQNFAFGTFEKQVAEFCSQANCISNDGDTVHFQLENGEVLSTNRETVLLAQNDLKMRLQEIRAGQKAKHKSKAVSELEDLAEVTRFYPKS